MNMVYCIGINFVFVFKDEYWWFVIFKIDRVKCVYDLIVIRSNKCFICVLIIVSVFSMCFISCMCVVVFLFSG